MHNSVVSFLSFFVAIIVAGLGIYFTLYKEMPLFDQSIRTGLLKVASFFDPNHASSVRLMTKEELSRYTGEDGSLGLYIAIIGRVYDVSKGARHYGPSGGYHFFSGRDASRAFVTGNFDTGLTDDLSDLQVELYSGLDEWRQFYEKDYMFIGHVCGTFYDCQTGQPTAALDSYNEKLKEANILKLHQKNEASLFPPCNSQWSQGKGGYVWCSEKSGGIARDWVGVPRKFHMKATGNVRCACVRTSGPPSGDLHSTNHNGRGDLDDPRLKEYDNCDPNSDTCTLTES